MSYGNLSLLRKEELRTVRKSKREFKKELSFVKHLLNVFLKTFEVLGECVRANQKFTDSKDASYRISWKIFRIVRCAFNSSLEGYYDVSMALLRIAFENHLLLTYLAEHEEEAKLWFEGKRFAPYFLRKNVSWSSDSLYRGMSEFVHSSFKSTFAFTKEEKDETKGTLGEYDREQFKNVLFLMLMILFTTVVWLLMTFPHELVMNEEWSSIFRETVPKIGKYLKSEISKGKERSL